MKLCMSHSPRVMAGYSTVARAQVPEVNVVHDFDLLPWPWESDSVQRIVAVDLVEHLRISLVEFCDEAWRILKPGGELFIRTPHHHGVDSWVDPTHRWHLHEESFQFFDPESPRGKNGPAYTSLRWRILSLGVREGGQIHALLTPRK